MSTVQLVNPVKQRVAAGGVALGMPVRLGRSAEIARIAKATGHDFIFIDVQLDQRHPRCRRPVTRREYFPKQETCTDGDYRRSACVGVQGRGHAIHRRTSRRRVG
jgi:hypothetical protein